jgi:hypothetical protein
MKKTALRNTILFSGFLLIAAAALLSGSMIEHALVSDPSRGLSWGPSLFRALLAFHGAALIAVAFIISRHDGPAEKLAQDRSSARAQKTGRFSWAVLIFLCAIAFALRLWGLDLDLWHDEIIALLDFVRPPLGDIVTSFPNQNQHLLYSVLAHLSVNVFGESAWAVRLPAVLFGVGSIWALFLLGRAVIGEREALLASALMTVSYHHIWFSQNARGYTGLLLFVILAVWLWLEALKRNGWREWLLYSAVASLGLLLHMTMAFVIAAQGLLYLILLVGQLRRDGPGGADRLELRAGVKPLVAWILCGTVTLQFYALSLPEFLTEGLHEVSLPSDWTNPLWVISESIRNLKMGFSGTLVLACGAVMLGVGWLSIFRRNLRAGVLMVLPALLAGASMLALGHNLWPRFFFFSMGFALLIVVRGAMEVPRLAFALIKPLRSFNALSVKAGVALAGVIILASCATVPRNYALPKQDFTGARDYVERIRQPNDTVLVVGLAAVDYGSYFAPHWSVVATQAEIDAVRQNQSGIWLVYTLPIHVKAWHPEVWDLIQRDFEVVKVFPGTLGGGEVYVCRQRDQGAAPYLSRATED